MKINFKNIVTASTLFVGAIAFGQQIGNANFEAWENVGADAEEPINWNSFYTASGPQNGYARKTVWRDNGRAGAGFCAKIETVSGPFGVTVNGNMTLGQVNMGSTNPANENNHNATRPGNAAFSETMTTRPDSIVYWVNYQPASGDQASVSVILHDNFEYKYPESGSSPDHAIAYALNIFGNTSGWTRVSIPFSYTGASTNNPAYILMNCTPSAVPGGGTVGSKLYIDDIELIYNPIITTSAVAPLSYTVTNTLGSNIDIPFTLQNGPMLAGNVFTAQLSDANGNFGAPTNIGTLNSTTAGTINATIPAGTPGGTGYRVRVVGNNPNIIGEDNGANITINLIGNSIAPNTSQSLLIGVDGTELTVTENPAASSREWKYATTQGGPYVSFAPVQTGVNYTPNFGAAGSYYIICESVIGGDNIVSNEVAVNVGAATINTNDITPLVYEFSPSSPNGLTSVSFTTSGAFIPGNIFSAELSDGSGSFATPTVIGSLTSTTPGTISLTIPNTVPSGNGYRVRIVGSTPSIIGSDNGSDIVITQFANELSDNTTQDLELNTVGTTVSVMENQSVISRKWQYSQTSGSGYMDFTPSQVGTSYTPIFATPGTYYVVCKSTNIFGDEVTSDELMVNVANGTTITISTVYGSPFNLSPSANLVVPINFTSDVVFDNGNEFNVELSDASGDFTSPVVIGTLAGNTIAAIDATIPNGTPEGTGYRIRVVSTSPAIIGSENTNDLIVDQFSVSLDGATSQTISTNTYGAEITVEESQIATREWKWSTTSGSGYQSFPTIQTLTNYNPYFENDGTYYVVCESTNSQWGDTEVSDEVVIIVDSSVGIDGAEQTIFQVFNADGNIQIKTNTENTYHFNLYDLSGKKVFGQQNQLNNQNYQLNLGQGIYLFEVQIGTKVIQGKINL